MPVEQRSLAHESRAIIIAITAVLMAVGLLFVIASWGGRDGGSGGLKLGDEAFEAGQVERIANEIKDRGPILYSDVAGGERDIYLVHLGDELELGWSAFAAQQPGADRDCFVEWDVDQELFVDPCTGETFLADGTGLPQFVVIIEDEELVIDLNDVLTEEEKNTAR